MTLLSASTLGAPTENLDTVLNWLDKSGVDAIELRVASGQVASPAMGVSARARLRARLEDAGVTLTGLATYVRIGADTDDEVVVGALAGALQLGADLGAPMVRVFPSAPPATNGLTATESPNDVDARAARRLNAVAHLARDLDVFPAVETHDSHLKGEDVARILNLVDGPVGAIWDLLHTVRAGESIEETWRALSPWLTKEMGGVQVKDATLPGLVPTMIGEGALPVDEFAELLKATGYSGTITLEWEKAWNPSIPSLEESLASAQSWFQRHWPE